MRFIGQLLLVILFIIFVSITIIAASAKFGLLNYGFWVRSFDKHNTYVALSEVVKKSVDSQVKREGGDRNDVAILTDLITPLNTKEFTDRNLYNSLSFVNGNSSELKIYVPLAKIPEGIMPANIGNIKEEMTVDELSNRFNITGLNGLSIAGFSKIGVNVYYVLVVSTTMLVIISIFIILLIEQGKRLTPIGISLLLSGLVILGIADTLRKFVNYLNVNYMDSSSINKVLVVTILPPVTDDLIRIWNYVGVACLVIGVIMFFIKKPGNTNKIMSR